MTYAHLEATKPLCCWESITRLWSCFLRCGRGAALCVCVGSDGAQLAAVVVDSRWGGVQTGVRQWTSWRRRAPAAARRRRGRPHPQHLLQLRLRQHAEQPAVFGAGWRGGPGAVAHRSATVTTMRRPLSHLPGAPWLRRLRRQGSGKGRQSSGNASATLLQCWLHLLQVPDGCQSQL